VQQCLCTRCVTRGRTRGRREARTRRRRPRCCHTSLSRARRFDSICATQRDHTRACMCMHAHQHMLTCFNVTTSSLRMSAISAPIGLSSGACSSLARCDGRHARSHAHRTHCVSTHALTRWLSSVCCSTQTKISLTTHHRHSTHAIDVFVVTFLRVTNLTCRTTPRHITTKDDNRTTTSRHQHLIVHQGIPRQFRARSAAVWSKRAHAIASHRCDRHHVACRCLHRRHRLRRRQD
jgi:hypothetical protein